MDYIKKLLFVFAVSALVLSCNNNKKNSKDADSIDDVDVETTVKEALELPLPSSVDIIDMLNKTGAGYVFEATNPAENIDNYLSYSQKAINLGVYGADLSYNITYSKKNETATYLDNFIVLIEDLKISNLDKDFFVKVQDNLDNKDSLMAIVKGSIYGTHNFLKENNKEDIALYALVGSWTESLYLVSSTLDYAQDKDKLYELLLMHKDDLENIISLMKDQKDTEGFKDLYPKMEEINEMFVKIDGNTSDLDHIGELRTKVTEFRNSLI